MLSDEPVPPRRLQPQVPRDLETVCLKCLEKQPGRRYASAGELADDLGRFLANWPVVARPAGRVYRFGKFAQRHKGLVAGLGAAFLALAVGVVGTSLGQFQATRQRDLAREAERETRRLLAASHYDAARLAMRRGDWREALARMDRALEAGHADSAALRLDRVRAWCAVHEVPRAAREVEALARRTDLGGLRGQVLLWQADLALNRGGQETGPALDQVRQALELGLPSAEAAYARGLLAHSSPEAVTHFQEALRADPFNPRTNGMLALLLTALGRHDEAQDRLLVAELLFPEDPSFRVVHAMLLALQDRKEAAAAQLAHARGQLRDKQLATAEALLGLCNFVPRLRETADALLADDPKASPARLLLQSVPHVTRLRAALGDPEGDLFLPLPPVLPRAFQELPSLASLTSATVLRVGVDDTAAKLRRAAEMHPEGFLYFTLAVLLATKDTPEGWAEAEKAFARAAESPSLLNLRHEALYGLAASQWVLSKEGPSGEREEMRRRARQSVRKVVALGVRPEQGYPLSTMVLSLEDLGAAHWVLSEWERQAPKDPRLPEQRILCAFRSGDYGRAVKLVDEAVKAAPKEARRWEKLRAAAAARLREQAKGLDAPR